MSLLDLFILIPILFFSIKGIKNGLVGEVLGIVGLVAAVYFTFEYMDEVADVLRSFSGGSGSYYVFLAAALIFILTLIAAQLLDYLASNFFKIIRFQTVNRIFGFFFGLLKGAIIVSAILIILAGFQYPSQQTRQQSLTYSYVVYIAPWAYNTVADQNFADTIEDAIEDTIEDFPILNNK